MNKDELITRSLEKVLRRLVIGEIIDGEVVAIVEDNVIVDIGRKEEATAKISEFTTPPSIGDKYRFLVQEITKSHGVILSKSGADELNKWNRIEKIWKEGTEVNGKIIKFVKDGWLVLVNDLEAFLPKDEFDIKYPQEPENIVGKEFTFIVTKVDRNHKNIFLSRKILRERERKKFWSTITEGNILEGEVKKITNFGVFIDLEFVDGFIHISDLSWKRLSHPSEVVSIGDKIKAKVLSINIDDRQISLGVKQLTPSPWENVEEKYPIGTKVKCKVTNIQDYGAFVEIEPGLDGLIHISDMSWTKISHPTQVISIGDIIDAIVLNVEPKEYKISLGMKQLMSNPFEKIKEKYHIGEIITGTVKGFSKFGAYIEIENDIEGFVRISDMSWNYVDYPGDLLKKGDKIKCKVLEINPSEGQIFLGIKQLEEDPLNILEKEIDKPIKGRIKSIIENKGIFVKFMVDKYKMDGFVPISQLVNIGKNKNIEDNYKIKQQIDVEVIKIDKDKRKIFLSEKKYYEKEERKEIQKYLKDQK